MKLINLRKGKVWMMQGLSNNKKLERKVIKKLKILRKKVILLKRKR